MRTGHYVRFIYFYFFFIPSRCVASSYISIFLLLSILYEQSIHVKRCLRQNRLTLFTNLFRNWNAFNRMQIFKRLLEIIFACQNGNNRFFRVIFLKNNNSNNSLSNIRIGMNGDASLYAVLFILSCRLHTHFLFVVCHTALFRRARFILIFYTIPPKRHTI